MCEGELAVEEAQGLVWPCRACGDNKPLVTHECLCYPALIPYGTVVTLSFNNQNITYVYRPVGHASSTVTRAFVWCINFYEK